jgi:PAS domain-containing protein
MWFLLPDAGYRQNRTRRAGPTGVISDNRGKRAKEESANGFGFISVPSFSAMKPPEDSEQIMIDSIPVMAWRCRPDGFVEFFSRRWLEYTGLSLDKALGWGWAERRWYGGVVDDGDLGIAKDDRDLVRLHIGIAVDRKRRVSGAPQLLGDRG